jgi:magnesium chelatase subunit I
VGEAFSVYLGSTDLRSVISFFESGGNLKVREDASSEELVGALRKIPGLMESLSALNVAAGEPAAVTASAAEFVLEGLYGQKKIGRSDDRGFVAPERHAESEVDMERLERLRRMKKQVN